MTTEPTPGAMKVSVWKPIALIGNLITATVCIANDATLGAAITAFGFGHLLRWMFEDLGKAMTANAHR